MALKKHTKKYYFSVEGQTEKAYLDWLQNMINNSSDSICKVSFDCMVQPDPVKRVKGITIAGKTDIWHLYDYESNDPEHTKRFVDTMDKMKTAEGMGKQIKYYSGYSNLTFDLWIILHKIDCFGTVPHRKNYLQHINKAYSTAFQSMDEYKEADNFRYCLSTLDINSVIQAIDRAKRINQINTENAYTLHRYKSFAYYKENPALDIWIIIEKILKDCKLI